MRLAFLRATTAYERMLARGTKWWHSAIVFSDGIWGTSLPRHGVYLGSAQGIGAIKDYDFVDVPFSDLEEAAVYQWFVDHRGDAYDWSAYLGGRDNANREYCTEAVLLATGLFTDLVPHKTRASELYERAIKQFGLTEKERVA